MKSILSRSVDSDENAPEQLVDGLAGGRKILK
jgi:hypothetical protein